MTGPATSAAPPLSPDEAAHLAHRLGGDVAFLRARQALYFARYDGVASPVRQLLRGIHELEPQRARWIVRHRVFSTLAPTASCSGAVKVAGRVLRAPVTARDHGLPTDGMPWIDAGSAVPPPRRASAAAEAALASVVADGPSCRGDGELVALVLRWARTLAELPLGEARRDRPVAALLADPGGRVLEWATNTASTNVTGHAELNLVDLALARWGALPEGVVVSSLKPCKMCAGALWDAARARQSLRVVFAEDDPGRGARETVLEPGTMARRAFSGPAERFLAPQEHHRLTHDRPGISRA